MKLPNIEAATIPQSKITDYLLSATHSFGQGKAGFFSRFGFSQEKWQALMTALLKHASENDVTKVEASPFGTRYVIEGQFEAVDGRKPLVRSVWFINTGKDIPRLVSAYPLRQKHGKDEK